MERAPVPGAAEVRVVDLDEVRRDFAPLANDVAGILLWGSHAVGDVTPRSDIDVCIVTGPKGDPVDALLQGLGLGVRAGKPYDVRVFEELPLFLKGAVLEHGRVVATRDPVQLEDYLWPWRKVWSDQLARQRRWAEA